MIKVLADSFVSGFPVLSWQGQAYFPRVKMSLAAMTSAFSASLNHKVVSQGQMMGPRSIVTDNYSIHCY